LLFLLLSLSQFPTVEILGGLNPPPPLSTAAVIIIAVTANAFASVYMATTNLYTVKKVSDFPVPSRDVTNLILPGRE
jgi:hypothetical protein